MRGKSATRREGGNNPPRSPAASRADLAPVLISAAAFSALSVWMAFASRGFLEADGAVHYLMARFAPGRPWMFTDVWGRPLVTALYALPASLGGLAATRLTSLAVALATAAVAWKVAAGQGVRFAALAFVFTLAQPVLFLHSFSELTELPFALLGGLAFWAYQRRRWAVFAALCGLMPLARPEGFGGALVAAVLVCVHRRPWWVVLVVAPTVAWSALGWEFGGRQGAWWAWLFDNWPWSGESVYERGSAWKFAAVLPAIVGPFVVPATLAGAALSLAPLRRWRSLFDGGDDAHRRRCDVFIAAVPLGLLAVHSVLYATGKMASNGEPRYLLAAGPFWAVLSARGFGWACDRLRIRRVYAAAGVASLAVVLPYLAYPTLPLVQMDDWRAAARVAAWYRASAEADYPHLLASHPGVAYALDRPMDGTSLARVDERPAGTALVFDPVYSRYNADARRVLSPEAIAAAGWVEVPTPGVSLPEGWRVYVSP